MGEIIGFLLWLWFVRLMWRTYKNSEIKKKPKSYVVKDPDDEGFHLHYFRRSTTYGARAGRRYAHRNLEDG